ncbi:replication factor A protein 1-like [Tetranychus urticae]|uniref:Replication protein A subunit n=1 Tax=Tetranychus urticae TaxID=32264 RepID=T1KEL2_TETUR|nr:replication factor A protein 1-like [Tetranychus urticae]
MSLSTGSIQSIISGRFILNPKLQLVSISMGDEAHRYCQISDGIDSHPCVISIVSGLVLREGLVIQLKNYLYHFSLQFNKNIIEIINFDIPDVEPGIQDSVPPASDTDLLNLSSSATHQLDINNEDISAQDLSSDTDLLNLSSNATHQLDISNEDNSAHDLSSNIALDRSPSDHTSVISRPSILSNISPVSATSGSSLPVITPTKRLADSISPYSLVFTPASALYAKRSKNLFLEPIPIKDLSFQLSWKIKGRVIRKGGLGNMKSGNWHWFCFEVSDLSGTIKINAFKQESTRFFDVIKLGKVFSISNGDLVPVDSSKLPYNRTGHPYEITLKNTSVIREETNFNEEDYPNATFVKISSLKNMSPGAVIDTLGVCIFSTLISNGSRRSVLILDDSAAEIRVSVWNLSPSDFNPAIGSVIVLRGAKLTHQFFGRILTISSVATVEVDPDIPEVHSLLEWFKTHGATSSSTSLSRGFVGETSLINSLPLSLQSNVIMFTNLEVSVRSGSGYIYQAHTDCGKKVQIYKGNIPVCEECKDTRPDLLHQLVITLQVSDSSGQAEVVAFTDVALELLNITLDDVPGITNDDITSALNSFTDKNFKFCVKSRETFFHGKSHIQHSIKYFTKINSPEI